ncbi:MAG TPA: carboxypeptidase-like regulatory domain-containing protein, partial [Pyrinomonadaceae bacterium]
MVGTVFDPTGAPIDGADVTVFADERVMTSKANQHGAFEFPHLPPDARYVEASSPGFAAMSIAVIDKIPEEVSFT